MNDALTPPFDTKVAFLVRDDLETWQRLNVTAFLASGIAAPTRSWSASRTSTRTASSTSRCSASGARLRGRQGAPRRRAGAALRRQLPVAVYTSDMFRTGHDAANRAVVRAVAGADLDLVGLAVHGPKNAVEQVPKGSRLHPSCLRSRHGAPEEQQALEPAPVVSGMPHVTVDGTKAIRSTSRRKSFVFFRNPRRRVHPEPVRYTRDRHLAIDKQALVLDAGSPYFTTPHFDGHPPCCFEPAASARSTSTSSPSWSRTRGSPKPHSVGADLAHRALTTMEPRGPSARSTQ